MKKFPVLVAVTLLLIAAIAYFMPAALLDARLDAVTQGQLRVADAAGTVWNGRGVVTGERRTWSLPISWKVDPWSLARGDAVIALRDADGVDLPRATLAWRNGVLTLDGIAFTLPAAAFDGAVAASNVVALGGDVVFDAPHFSWNGNAGDGAASARWTGARIAGNAGTLALGTVTINFTPRDGVVVGHIENRGGDVRIDGEVTFSGSGSNGSVTLSPLPSTPPAINRALAALGTPDVAGAVRLQWRSGKR